MEVKHIREGKNSNVQVNKFKKGTWKGGWKGKRAKTNHSDIELHRVQVFEDKYKLGKRTQVETEGGNRMKAKQSN